MISYIKPAMQQECQASLHGTANTAGVSPFTKWINKNAQDATTCTRFRHFHVIMYICHFRVIRYICHFRVIMYICQFHVIMYICHFPVIMYICHFHVIMYTSLSMTTCVMQRSYQRGSRRHSTLRLRSTWPEKSIGQFHSVDPSCTLLWPTCPC